MDTHGCARGPSEMGIERSAQKQRSSLTHQASARPKVQRRRFIEQQKTKREAWQIDRSASARCRWLRDALMAHPSYPQRLEG